MGIHAMGRRLTNRLEPGWNCLAELAGMRLNLSLVGIAARDVTHVSEYLSVSRQPGAKMSKVNR